MILFHVILFVIKNVLMSSVAIISSIIFGRKEGKLILFPEQREKNNDSLESMKLDSLAANMKILNDKIDNLTNSFNQFLSLLQHNQ